MHIHIADFDDDNVRMILPPSSNGQAPTVYTYTVSGVNASQGMSFDGTHIHLSDEGDDNVRMILPPSGNGIAPTVWTYTVDGLNVPTGMAFDGTHIHLSDEGDDNVRMILPPSADGQAPTVYTYTVSGLNVPTGMAFDGTHIHISDYTDNNVRMILPPSADGQASIVFTYTVSGLGDPAGMAFDGTHIHIVDNADDNVRMILPPSSNGQAPTVYTYTVDGLGRPTGMTFDGIPSNQATLTLSTTDTDIRVGEAVDIDIDSDIDISNFVASDCTVTNGTRGALTINSATSATLRVTAGSAGTMTISIAEDAVDPGNAAVSQPFTVNALPTGSIAFSVAEARAGVPFVATITFSENAGGFDTNDVTISAGTKGTFNGSGDTYTLIITPPTGDGTITVTVQENAIDAGNAAFSAIIFYIEPLSLGWIVPTSDVGNTFAVTLTSNLALTGVELSDFRLIQRNPTNFINLSTSEPEIDAVSLTAVSGTHNWQIDFTLNGTYDNEFEMRLVREMVVADGVDVPITANLTSSLFTVDSSVGAIPVTFGSETIGNQAWVVGTADSITLPEAMDGTGTITYSLSSTLPAGMTFTASTRVLAGTPTGRFSSATFTYTATDGNGDTVELTFTIVVTATAISFASSVANQSWVVGTAVNITLPAASGGVGSFTYSLTPALPAGVSRSNRVVSGTPTARATVATYTYTATDSEGVTHTLTFTVVVTAVAITFASTIANQSWQVGTAVNLTLPTASGGVGAFTYSLTPALPAGVTRSNRVLSGTPTTTVTVATYTYTATDAEGVASSRTFTIVVVSAAPVTGLMYIHIADFADDNVRMILPPTSNGQADTVWTYTISGLGSPEGMAFDGTHVHIVDDTDNNVRMILPPSSDGQAPTVWTYTVDGLGTPRGITFDGTHIHIVDYTDNNVRMILPPTSDGQAPTVFTYTVNGVGSPEGMTFDGTHIHISDYTDNNVRMILPPSSDGQASIVRTYTVNGLGDPAGMAFDGTHIHIADFSDNNVRMILPPDADGQAPTVFTYTVSGVNNPTGMTFGGAIQSQATLTLSTTDTDIRVGEAVDIEIASNIDIRNFTASDCTVANGTRGALTINSATSATLRVTAGSAGTMTVAIAEDAVTPSNAAVSQPFTVNARVVPTITFDSTTGESGGSTGINITFGESVTGLLLSHLTASDGTLSNVTGSGTAWEADLAFPATGSGTVDIDLAIDSTTPQNAAASASIDYAEPAAALSFGSESINNQAWVVGTADSITLPEATGGTGTITYSLSPTLPAGKTFTASTRVLSGNPTGRFSSATFTYTATDTAGTTNVLTFIIVVTAPAIVFSPTSFANQSWVVGTAISRTLPAGSGGVGTLTASLSPTTPAGVSFTASTRALAGNPTATFTSTTFTYTMTDAEGESESITFTIVVTAALITLSFGSETISNQAWVAGTAVSVTLPVATGGTGDKTYTLSPTTPAGITFTGTTRVLAGTPTATFTSATFTYTAEDEDGNTVDLTFTIVVTATAITFASTIADQSWVVGTAVSVTLPTASGGVGDLTYSLSPTTPAGITFTAGTQVLAGNPTAVFTLATFTYTVTDAESETETQTFTIVVSAVIVVAPTTSTEATYDADLGYNVLPEALGGLRRINAAGSVENLGNLWYEQRPYNVAATRCLSFDDALHITIGYGNIDEVLRYNSLASHADNYQHLVFGQKLAYVVPTFPVTGTIYEGIADIARKVNLTLSIENNTLSLRNRMPIRAETDGATGTGTGNLSFDKASRTFPASGYLLIDNEILSYTGVASGAFTGIGRGVLGSPILNHADNTKIVYMNYRVPSSRLIGTIHETQDTQRISNIIRDSDNNFEARDAVSIAVYKKRQYDLNLGLTHHESAWQESVFAEYLAALKDPHTLQRVRIKPANYIKVHDTFAIRVGALTSGFQVVSLTYGEKSTDIQGRTV